MNNYIRWIITGLISISMQPLRAQSLEDWRYGSAYELKGNVYTLSVFISRQGKGGWTDEEKRKVLAKQSEAMSWLKTQALNYGIKVNFEACGVYGFEEDIKMTTIERGTASGNEPGDWVSRMLYKLGYKSSLDIVKWVHSKTNAQQIQVLIYAKGRGRSYAMSSREGVDKEQHFVEGAIVYEQNNDGQEMLASTIAHEILHLYGAWDLYQNQYQSSVNDERSRLLFPNSIMRIVSHDINELEVDEVSAWLAGWNPNQKAWYESLNPRGR